MTRDELLEMKARASCVPCGDCRACCEQDVIRLDPGKDDLTAFAWHDENGPVLDRKPNGQCIYLTAKGCGIHGRAPDVCRRFDCRVLFLLTPKDRRRMRIAENPTMRRVYDAGKRRLTTLKRQNGSSIAS